MLRGLASFLHRAAKRAWSRWVYTQVEGARVQRRLLAAFLTQQRTAFYALRAACRMTKHGGRAIAYFTRQVS